MALNSVCCSGNCSGMSGSYLTHTDGHRRVTLYRRIICLLKAYPCLPTYLPSQGTTIPFESEANHGSHKHKVWKIFPLRAAKFIMGDTTLWLSGCIGPTLILILQW